MFVPSVVTPFILCVIYSIYFMFWMFWCWINVFHDICLAWIWSNWIEMTSWLSTQTKPNDNNVGTRKINTNTFNDDISMLNGNNSNSNTWWHTDNCENTHRCTKPVKWAHQSTKFPFQPRPRKIVSKIWSWLCIWSDILVILAFAEVKGGWRKWFSMPKASGMIQSSENICARTDFDLT
jgi:hypothetical protein